LPHALHMFRFMITFVSCFMMGKAPPPNPMWGPFPKCGVRLGYSLDLGPLFWGIPSPWIQTFFTRYKLKYCTKCTFTSMKLQVSLHSCAFSLLITIRCPWHGEWHACGLWTNNNPLRLMLLLVHIHPLHWVVIVSPFLIDLIFVILLVPSSIYQSNTIHDKSIEWRASYIKAMVMYILS
jgi:hypothetical protein